jgi:tRNA threonylcarbamoyladenosine biosynthesis protein TsaB
VNTITDPNAWSLAVETSGNVGSVAIGRGAQVRLAESFDTRRNHGVALLPTVDRLVRECGIQPPDVERVFVSGGPGSFTGLRIGVTFAKALAHATGTRVVRVPTLTALAHNALDLPQPPARVVALLDAKRDHVYAAGFELTATGYEPRDEPAERDPASYLAGLGEVAVLGEGVERHGKVLADTANVTVLAESTHRGRAENVYRVGVALAAAGAFTPPGELIPLYVRKPEAEERWEKQNRTLDPHAAD